MFVDFSYKVVGLEITLYNLSTDFGTCVWEATSSGAIMGTSTSKDKWVFTASATGIYAITLQVSKTTSGDVETTTKGLEIYLVDSDNPTLVYSIIRQVDLIYPGMADENWESIERYKVKWQTILFPSLNETIDPSLDDLAMHEESKWPYFWNALISQLIARDIFMDVQTQLSGLSPGVQDGGGPIKRIETGPVNTEWYSQAKMMDTIFKTNGLFDEINKRICAMGRILNISFSWCKPQPFFPIKITPDTDVKTINKLLKYGSSYILSTFYN